MNCEHCNQISDGRYGSGRFCSSKCARSFSTKTKRIEINEKVKKKLTHEPCKKNCKRCSALFESKRKSQNFCCRRCAIIFNNGDPCVQEKLRMARLREIEKGNVGYGIKTELEGIRCDSALEYAFLKWYREIHPNSKIERFKGFLEDAGVKYQPDFIIDDKIVVEVKYTTTYVGKKLSEKWKSYLASQDMKKKLLSSHEFLWITEKDIGIQFYRKCLNEIKEKKDLKI